MRNRNLSRLTTVVSLTAGLFAARSASADTVTDWNQYTVEATKGFDGGAGAGVALDSNLGSRIDAVAARAVFDAVNSIDRFSSGHYYYGASNTGSSAAAAAQAAHDVLVGLLPNPATDPTADPRWAPVRTWVDAQLAQSLSALGVSSSDPGIAAGAAAAVAALQARAIDGAAPVTTYGAQLVATSNPGVGLWRQSNAGAPYVNPATGAPTGFDAGGTVIQGKPGVDLNWRDVTPFSLSAGQKTFVLGQVPPSPAVGSAEYIAELDFVKKHGQDSASSSARSADWTAQALFYKQDAEIFVNEAGRLASAARELTLDQNAKLFALLDGTVADARIVAFASKYDQKFWRAITAINADPSGAVTNGYAAWHPLAATPAHPSNTAGHSATGAAAFEILRAFFGTDSFSPDRSPVTLGSLPWLAGTNNGTGNVPARTVTTFSQAQLENGASRIYLGVHFGYDNLQGQLAGLLVADTILVQSSDPAAAGLRPSESTASLASLPRTLGRRSDVYGLFGLDTGLVTGR